MALRSLGFKHRLAGACDAKVALRRFIAVNFNSESIISDGFSRRLVAADLYVAGPLCVRFLHLGRRADEPDSTLEQSVRYIAEVRPRAFVFENVVGLIVFEGGSVFYGLLKRLRCGGRYDMHHQVCAFQAHGVHCGDSPS